VCETVIKGGTGHMFQGCLDPRSECLSLQSSGCVKGLRVMRELIVVAPGTFGMYVQGVWHVRAGAISG
jgi:hypothetical protein